MKKIILVSSPTSVFHAPVLRALRGEGYDVCCFDDRGHPVLRVGHPLHILAKLLPAGIRERLFRGVYHGTGRALLRLARTTNPDIIFFLKAKNIDVEILDELRVIARTMNWYPDAMNNWPSIQRLARHYDCFFVFDRSIVDALRARGLRNIYHMPFCGDLDKNAEWTGRSTYPHAITFLGSYHPRDYQERLAILMQIKDLGLEVWGNAAWLDTPLREQYRGPMVPDVSHIKKLYTESMIVIHTDANAANKGASGLTMRPFDATSAGSLLIAQDDRPEIFDLFRPGEEYISFHNQLDIREKVVYYLRHREERDRIARSGFYRTRSEHTYADRVRTMLRIVTDEINEKGNNI